ncbi:ADP-sugar diphosphatase [Cladobotryum mycophilum]|uniref:ADP-sugar diphosphatase n=1 Tax=Cladobotryum mycophilum TaxID=491253 RepID=A0ABR0S8B5_9HYPO
MKKLPPSLRSELSKLAGLGNIQSGLPPILRAAPVIAIRAGEVLSRATNGRNIIEDRILGFDEAFMLAAPGPTRQEDITTVDREVVGMRAGIEMMCGRCNKDLHNTADTTISKHTWDNMPHKSNQGQAARRNMSTFTISQASRQVSVSLPDGLSEDQVKSFRPFNSWIDTLTKSLALQSDAAHPFHPDPYALQSVTVQSYDLFGGGRLGFIKLTASVSNSAGETLPAAALLRGPSVAMLVMLIPDDAPPESNERYVILTVQPRIPVGSLSFVELPAGMVDDAGSFKGAAAKEIEEELGITIHEDELACLSELASAAAAKAGAEEENLAAAMFPSAGGCDEHITIYSHERRIPRSQLSEWEGRLTGLRSHGEKITLKVVPMEDLWKEGARDAKCLAAIALWQGLRQEKKL